MQQKRKNINRNQLATSMAFCTPPDQEIIHHFFFLSVVFSFSLSLSQDSLPRSLPIYHWPSPDHHNYNTIQYNTTCMYVCMHNVKEMKKWEDKRIEDTHVLKFLVFDLPFLCRLLPKQLQRERERTERENTESGVSTSSHSFSM